MAENGGLVTKTIDSACGNYMGYNILSSESRDCMPYDIIETFAILFNNEFGNYLSAYPSAYPSAEIGISVYDDFVIKEEGNKLQIYGISKEPVRLDIWNRKDAPSEEYVKTISDSLPAGAITPDKSPIFLQGCPDLPISGFVKDENCLSSNCHLRTDVKARLDSARERVKSLGGEIVLNSGWRNKDRGRHGTGGAVDIRLRGKNLNCGCAGEASCKSYQSGLFAYRDSEDKRGQAIHNCRMLLKEIMESAGFVNPAETENWRYKEWWHWEFGTKSWAVAKGETTRYEIIT
jgi:hypothetical protein